MLWNIFKTDTPARQGLVDWITPRKTFEDVILPERTRKQLRDALTQIEKRALIFDQWGLGRKHQTGLGLGFNFAGPPGTGKTLCAEALAHTLGRPLARVKYSQMESMWAGESGKNIAAVFEETRSRNAVLFFDEADAIASRRLTNVSGGYEREANQVINILLKEIEEYEGVVIFATNLATNFDPAFERRIRTHIYFETPGPEVRPFVWKAQLSPQTPLADDVDFEALGRDYEMTGGDIKNAVLKAAQMAAGEEGPDAGKSIHQHHFLTAIEEVLDARRVMSQSLYDDGNGNGLMPWEPLVVAARLEAVEASALEGREETALVANQVTALTEAVNALQIRLRGGTFIPLPVWATGTIALLVIAAVAVVAGVVIP
jgi:SpoVK/Ycf46/Vps4 family AAA+-type ATPase